MGRFLDVTGITLSLHSRMFSGHVGTILFQELLVCTNVTILQATESHTVDLVLALTLLARSTVGTQFSTRLIHRINADYLKIIFESVVLIIMAPDRMLSLKGGEQQNEGFGLAGACMNFQTSSSAQRESRKVCQGKDAELVQLNRQMNPGLSNYICQNNHPRLSFVSVERQCNLLI